MRTNVSKLQFCCCCYCCCCCLRPPSPDGLIENTQPKTEKTSPNAFFFSEHEVHLSHHHILLSSSSYVKKNRQFVVVVGIAEVAKKRRRRRRSFFEKQQADGLVRSTIVLRSTFLPLTSYYYILNANELGRRGQKMWTYGMYRLAIPKRRKKEKKRKSSLDSYEK